MKITNASIKPVEEELENKHNFIRVMPFLDHPNILSEIQNLRKQLGLKELIPYGKYQEWFDENTSENVSKQQTALIWDVYLNGCIKLLEAYNRQDIHYFSVWKATICNKINDTDCVSTYVEIIYPDLKPCLMPKLAIIFTPESTKEEIIRAFKTEKNRLIKDYLLYEVGKGSKVQDLLKTNVSIKQLKEQRKLYLKHKPGIFGYRRIADSFSQESRKNVGLEYVRTRINSYQRRVELSIRLPLR